MKNWIMAKGVAAKVALSLAAVLVVAAIGTGIYLGVKPSQTPVTNEVVSIGDETTPTTDAPVVEDNKEEETVVVTETETEVETIVVETEEEVRVKEGYSLVNGNFADGIFGYEVYAMNEGDIYYDITDAGFTIHISDTGTEDWHVQLKQNDILLEKGRWYKLSLDAKSDINRVITCTMQHNGNIDNNWTPYAPQKKLELGKNWKNYSIIFQMNENTDLHSVFNLSMGTVDGRRITKNHAVSINNIALEQLPANFTDSLRIGDNLIANPDFAYEDILWDASVVAPGQATTSFAGNKVTFNISNPGTVDWHVQLKQTGIKLKNNTGYKVSFNVSSTANRTIKLGVMDTNYVNWYGGGDISVGPETKTVTVNLFNTICDDSNAILMISMGQIEGEATPASTIVLSDFTMVEDNSVTAASAGNGGNYGPNPTTVLGGGWEVYDHECAHTNGSSVAADGSFVINVKNVGTEAWHAQMTNKTLFVENGKTYKVSFTGKSTVERPITYMIQRDGASDNNWDTYTTSNTALLTSEWTTFEQTFTMKSPTDNKAIYNFSFGKNDDNVYPAHTIMIKDIKFEEVAYNGPEKTETGYIVKKTNDQTTDEWGSKWVVNIEPSEFGMDDAQNKNVVIKATIKSEGSFDGLLGACFGDSWAWTDSSFEVKEDGETEVTLVVKNFMGALQIQINNMSADSVEIKDISVTELTEEEDEEETPSEETPSEETPTEPEVPVTSVVTVDDVTIAAEEDAFDDGYGLKWQLTFGGDAVAELVGKKVKFSADIQSDSYYGGKIIIQSHEDYSGWNDSKEYNVDGSGKVSHWEVVADDFKQAFIQIYWRDDTNRCDINVTNIKFEVFEGEAETPAEPETPTEDETETPAEENVIATITIKNHVGEYQIIPENYGIENPVGKAIKVTATLKGDAMFKGTIAGNVPGAWAQGAEFVSENGSETVWEYTLSSYVDFMKIDIWWAEATKIDILDIKVEDITFSTETPVEPSEEEPSEETYNGPEKTETGYVIRKTHDKTDGNWVIKLNPEDYGVENPVGKNLRVSMVIASTGEFEGLLGACRTDEWKWVDTGLKKEVDGALWSLNVNDYKGELQIQIKSMTNETMGISLISIEEDNGEEPEPYIPYIINSDTPKNDDGCYEIEIDIAQPLVIFGGREATVRFELESEGEFTGMIGGCNTDEWIWTNTEELSSKNGKAIWKYSFYDMKGALKLFIFSKEAEEVRVVSEAIYAGIDNVQEEPNSYVAVIDDSTPKNEDGNPEIELAVEQSLIGKKVRATVELESAGAFNGMLGGCNTSEWAWTNTEKLESGEGNKAVWRYDFYEMQGAFKLQIFWKEAASVNVTSVKFEEIVEDIVEETPDITYVAVIDDSTPKNEDGNPEIELAVEQSLIGKKVRATVELESAGAFNGMLGGCNTSEWAWTNTEKLESGEGNKAVWRYDFYEMQGAFKIQIFWKEADSVVVTDIKFEEIVEDDDEE